MKYWQWSLLPFEHLWVIFPVEQDPYEKQGPEQSPITQPCSSQQRQIVLLSESRFHKELTEGINSPTLPTPTHTYTHRWFNLLIPFVKTTEWRPTKSCCVPGFVSTRQRLLQSHRHIFNTWWSKLLHHADIWESPRWLYSVSCSGPTCLMGRRTNALHKPLPLTPDCSSYCCSHYCCRRKEEHSTLCKHIHYQVIAMSLWILHTHLEEICKIV